MTDFAMLEIAAMAARIHQIIVHSDGKVYACDGPGQNPYPWNPLDDDGDALRLANRTNTCIEFGYCMDDAPIVRCGLIEDRESWPQVGNFPDPGKATRRAIVEAVVAAQKVYEDAIAGVVPEVIPLPPESAIPAYQLLGRGDIVQRGDEVLADDTVNWLPLVGWEVGMQWGSHLMPMRRRLEATGESCA